MAWVDRQMRAIEEFDTTITLCFTPPSIGRRPHYTSPPVYLDEFAHFAAEVVQRYVLDGSAGALATDAELDHPR
jgi:hypothetical protein